MAIAPLKEPRWAVVDERAVTKRLDASVVAEELLFRGDFVFRASVMRFLKRENLCRVNRDWLGIDGPVDSFLARRFCQ